MLSLCMGEDLTNDKLGNWLQRELCPVCYRTAIRGKIYSFGTTWIVICPISGENYNGKDNKNS